MTQDLQSENKQIIANKLDMIHTELEELEFSIQKIWFRAKKKRLDEIQVNRWCELSKQKVNLLERLTADVLSSFILLWGKEENFELSPQATSKKTSPNIPQALSKWMLFIRFMIGLFLVVALIICGVQIYQMAKGDCVDSANAILATTFSFVPILFGSAVMWNANKKVKK